MYSTMYRAQILIEQWQYDALRTTSEREGRSISDIVREILAAALRPDAQASGGWIREVAGIGYDPHASGDDHDKYLYDAPDEFA